MTTRRRMRDVLWLVVIAVGSLLAGLYGAGMSYQDFITPRSSRGQFSRIYGDSWLANGATISLVGLAGRGNQALLEFGSWHPADRPPAHLRVRVCGELASDFFVTPGMTQPIYLTGSCEPRLIEFEVVNPFHGSETDSRELGAQLDSVRLTSKLGVPLVSLPVLLVTVVAIFALCSIFYAVFSALGMGPLACALPLAAWFVLKRSKYFDLERPFSLWLALCALGVGLLVASRVSKRSLRMPTVESASGTKQVTLKTAGLLLLVLAGAVIVRLTGLDFGLPEYYHPDEVPKYNAIMRMRSYGDLNPRYFLHPSVLLYSTYFMNNILRYFGLAGEWDQTLIFAGRSASALAGVLSVYFVFVIGTRLYSVFAGLVAAAVLAAAPLHVTCSRYVKEDAILVCITLGCVVALLKAVQEDRKWLLCVAGFLAGASASTKYSGLLSVAILFTAPWMRSGTLVPDRTYLKWTAIALLFFPLGFVACTPFSVLDYETFLKDFKHEQNHMTRGHTITIDAWSQLWMYHFYRSILPGMSYAAGLVGVAGLGLLIWRRRMSDLFVLALVLLFYLPAEYVKAKPAPQPERYILPVLPFLAIAAGELLRMLRRVRAGSALAIILAGVAIGLPAYRSAHLAEEVQYDTRAQMEAWMRTHIPPGSTVFIDWKPYSPRFLAGGITPVYLDRARIIPSLDIDTLRESGVDYLLLSSLFYNRYFSQPNANPALREQIRQVFRHVPVVKEILPEHGTYGFHNPTITLFSLKAADFARLEDEQLRKKAGEIESTSNELRASFRWGE